MNSIQDKKVLVIIVTFNGIEWIEDCLHAVFASTFNPDVMVIDNMSTDATCTIVEKFSDVIFIKNAENIGFGRANNTGLRYALDNDYDYAFLLNQDTTVEPDMFERLILAFEQNPEYGILSPVHLTGSGSALDSRFYGYLISSYSSYVQDCMLNRVEDSVYSGYFVNAAFWLISRECIKHAGGFDPIFSHTGEDNDYINRTISRGFKVGIVPGAYGYHRRENRRQLSVNDLFYHKYVHSVVALKSRQISLAGILYSVFLNTLVYFANLNFKNMFLNIKLFAKIVKVFSKIRKSRAIEEIDATPHL